MNKCEKNEQEIKMKLSEPSYLPLLNNQQKGFLKGRSPYEGSQRGWGLQFGDLKDKILNDPIYIAAFEKAKNKTVVSEENRMNIYLIMRYFLSSLPFGHIIEYGSYKGGNAVFMAVVAKLLHPKMKVYALDTYEGMPITDKNIDMHNEGDFKDTSFDELCNYKKRLGLDNLILVKGLFEETNEKVMKDAKNVCLAHIDCDIKSACRTAYEGVRKFMVKDGYIVFDDATVSSCLGATEVVEDLVIKRDGLNSEQIWPHFVFRCH